MNDASAITAIVTGGASGIGAAVARRIVASGGRVGLLDLNEEGARALAAELGAVACAAPGDVLDEQSLARSADLVEARIGRANALVCCAGIPQVPRTIEEWPTAEFRRIVDSHLTGTYASCRVVGGRIAAHGQGGAIVTISSVVGVHPGPVLAYGPAKAAVASLTQILAVHWAARKVRVNAVAPGWTDTPFLRPKERQGERDFTPILAATPMGRLMQPQEVAETIHFLLSPAASGITGALVPCDGGVLAGAGWFPYGGFGHA
ncbi:MAG TPA: SDR family NAD(P)-dependent oxidoreductase [Usitatibacter sp.]|jgi:NAD(P)-dependent dehydrogenase (short-subunit alcohol dehydrogenase family)|nr:SDR family NAD(P)-dependent oxidoreductase [Usitatibacter sp.]